MTKWQYGKRKKGKKEKWHNDSMIKWQNDINIKWQTSHYYFLSVCVTYSENEH